MCAQGQEPGRSLGNWPLPLCSPFPPACSMQPHQVRVHQSQVYQMLAFVHKLPCRDDDGVTAKDLSKVCGAPQRRAGPLLSSPTVPSPLSPRPPRQPGQASMVGTVEGRDCVVRPRVNKAPPLPSGHTRLKFFSCRPKGRKLWAVSEPPRASVSLSVKWERNSIYHRVNSCGRW